MKNTRVKIPIYFGVLEMIRVKSMEDLKPKYGVDLSDAYEAVVFENPFKNKATRYCVAFVDGNISNKTIAHEVVHLVSLIFIDRGIRYDPFNDEPQAYLSGWLFEQCEEFIKKTNACI